MIRSDNGALSAHAGRGSIDAAASSSDEYRVVLPRFPDGKMCLNSVFLHADLMGRPYRAVDFRDGLKDIVDMTDVVSIGQFQMSHIWMITLASMAATEKMKRIGQLTVKGRKCLVLDPNAKDIRVRLLWLPTYLEDRRVVEALEPYGKVRNIVREKWRVPGMEHLETMNREVSMTLHDAVSSSDLPHMIKVYGVQSLVIVPGRPPLCLRCKKVGHIRKQCRAPKCTKCNKFGHEDNECYATYATVLRRGDEDAESNLDQFMDVSEVVGANGEVGASTGGPANSLPSVPGETGAINDHQPQDPGAIPVSSQTGDDSSMEQGSNCGSAATPSELDDRDQGETKQAGPFPEGQGNGVDTNSALGTGVSDVKRKKLEPGATYASKRLNVSKPLARQAQEKPPP